jgi:hypothetical protein
MRLRVFGIVAVATITPCFAANAPQPQSAGPSPESSGLTPQPLFKSIWREDEKNAIVHLQSGLSCDAHVGTFRRQDVHVYKPTGLDISCNYMDAQRSLITLYLTRRDGNSLADDFTEAEREMLQISPDTSPLSAPTETNGLRSALYARSGGTIREGIWVGDITGWTLEYRATWKPSDEAVTLDEISALTAMASRTAGTLLGLCAKSPVPARDGTALIDKSEIQQTLIMASLMMGGQAMLSKKDGTTRFWCAESVVGQDDDSYLLWHAILADGADAGADKLTGFTAAEPVPLMSEADELTNKVLAEAAKTTLPKRRWTLSRLSDTGTWLYGFYDGRPTTSDLAKMMTGIEHRTAHPLSGFDPKTKKITIVTGN